MRLTGYDVKGNLVPDEAAIVRAIFERFAAGDSLRGITVWLTGQGVVTRHGGRWNPSSVRSILLNPRYAGRAVYCGQTNGHTGRWTPIVDESTFEIVRETLGDKRRRSQVGTDRKYLGSSLYLCGICDRPVRSHSGGRYRCPAGGHVIRVTAGVDDYVLRHIRARLAARTWPTCSLSATMPRPGRPPTRSSGCAPGW